MYTYYSKSSIPMLCRVEVYLLSRKYTAVVFEETLESEIKKLLQSKITIKHIDRVIDTVPLLHDDHIALARWMSNYYIASLGECIFTLLPSARKEKSHMVSQTMISYFSEKKLMLTDEQRVGIDTILTEYQNKKKKPVYVYGVTGSGKTEVFLQSAQYMIQESKQVIYLVPEISLVMQNYPAFCKRFGAKNIAILHSGLTASQRLKEWNRIAHQEAKIVLGVRSAIFAPVKNLGLIIIDEEHDTSYKSNVTPRYHARQIAFKRASLLHAVVVMGSATPSLESYYYMKKETFVVARLTKRVAGGAMPDIRVIPINHSAQCISAVLEDEMRKTLRNDMQVLLLLNRRGFSHTFLCEHCGTILSCPHCSVKLVYHKEASQRELRCHYCGYKEPVPDACPSCGYVKLLVKGWGTQRVEEELSQQFPQYAIARLDSDVLLDKTKTQSVLESFYKKETHILIGTQMIAKGMNFPSLQLVGVLCADGLFSLPDFRATEWTFGLLSQVSGRSGRFFENGKVIIQTFMQDNPTLNALVCNQQDVFYDKELERRKLFSLAPFCRMLRLVFRGRILEKVEGIAADFIKMLQSIIDDQKYKTFLDEFHILGPTACAISRIANNHRVHVVLSAQSQKVLLGLAHEILITRKFQSKAHAKAVYIEINPDPQSLM